MLFRSGPSTSTTIKKTSVTKQVEAAKAAAKSEGRSITSKEARIISSEAKARNHLIDELNSSIEDEEKKAMGHLFGTGLNTFIWNGEKD